MTPERWQRIKVLFDGALSVDAAGRDAWLTTQTADDAELRAEVASLLTMHAREHAIVDKSAAAYVTGSGLSGGSDPWLGQRLGAYEIVALIGHGGMGEIYRARRVDAEYEKEVAIKLVAAGLQAEHVLQRLRAERQILAGLEHPNIARLIDGGASEQGVPYLVLELVDGVPIDEYCRDLVPAKKLALFRAVCDAVSYAHQGLIVHRDLKPGNILVTADGTVKLLDFGIAKLLQPGTGETPSAQHLTLMQTFTPGFASPEQVLGRPITTASDVYSLGVLLYLLLTGRSPYRERIDTTQDVIREVCEKQPLAPSAVAPLVPRDLDAICLRALRKEPDRRYRSVDEFSEDIRRHLAGLPVIARGDSLKYRGGKFLRRHRIEIAAASLVLVTLIGAVVVSLREARTAEAERARAERHFQSVRALADTFMFKVHDAIAPLAGSTEARELLVDTSLQYIDALAAESDNDQALQLDLAKAYAKVGDIQGKVSEANTGKRREALASYHKAAGLAQKLLGRDPANRDAKRALAYSQLMESRMLLVFGETKEALATSRRAVTNYESLSTLYPKDDGARLDLANAYGIQAIALDLSGLDGEGIETILKSIAMLEGLVEKTPRDRKLRMRLAGAYAGVASNVIKKELRSADVATAIDYTTKALRLEEAMLQEAGATDTELTRGLLVLHTNLTNLNNLAGDYATGARHCPEARAKLAQLRADPKNAETDLDAAMMELHCARSARGLGRYEDARRLANVNLAQLDRQAGKNEALIVRYLLGATQEVIASLAMRDGDLHRARERYREALANFELVSSKVTFDALDLVSVEEARTGLAQVERRLLSAAD